jgi:hypothetical protein
MCREEGTEGWVFLGAIRVGSLKEGMGAQMGMRLRQTTDVLEMREWREKDRT